MNLEALWQDIRYGVRKLVKSPGFTVVALIAIMLGVGTNSAIFSIVNTVLLRPLPYKSPDQLITVWSTAPGVGQSQLRTALPTINDWREQTKSFDGMAAYAFNLYNVTGIDEPEQVVSAQVSEDFFSVVGMPAATGRTLSPHENYEPLVVLSDAFWRQRFNADPNVAGKTLLLNGKTFTITGVMPPNFQVPLTEVALWTTLMHALTATPEQATSRGFHSFNVIARLKPGISLEQAKSDLNAVNARLQQQYPDTNSGRASNLIPLRELVVGDMRTALIILFGAVVFVLLIACANVANLLLARAVVRDREFAIRTALGAGRAILVRQLLTESLLLAFLGSALGLGLAAGLISLLRNSGLNLVPRLKEVSLDGTVLLFTLGVAIVSGLIFGIAPSLQTKVNLNDTLKESTRGSTGGTRGRRLRNVIVVAEVALSLVLLISAGLMIRSFAGLLRIEPGFNPEKLLTMQVVMPHLQYAEPQQKIGFSEQVFERVRALPGVTAVGASSGLPPVFNQLRNSFGVEGYQPAGASESMTANQITINNEYFKALETPLVQGREFDSHDTATSPEVVIISHSMVRRFFPDGNALGKRLTFGYTRAPEWRTIVGVAGDLKYSGSLYSEAEDAIYLPYQQLPPGGMYLFVRTPSEPQAMAAEVRNVVRTVDPDVPVAKIRSMKEVLAESVAQPRFYALLLGIFAAIALILASIGLYGVISYAVAQRTQELGVRMALGANTGSIIKLVVMHGLRLAIIGVAIGLFLAFGITRVFASLLYGIDSIDPLTFVIMPLLLILITLLASFVPARRATRVNPVTALRQS